MNKTVITTEVGGKEISLETGRLAKQASGSVLASSGNNMVLVTVVSSTRETDFDFMPLTVEFQEKYYSTGKIPGGFFKREGRPTANATLTCRLIDRPIRPLFPEGYNYDTQIVATVLSADGTFPVETLASIGASAALHISDVPFNGPICSSIVGRLDGKFVLNPSETQLQESDMEITIAGTRKGIMMVEGESLFISEDEALSALKFGHEAMGPVFQAIEELREKVGVPKREFTPKEIDRSFEGEVDSFLTPLIKDALSKTVKQERYAAFDEAKSQAKEKFVESVEDKDEKAKKDKEVSAILGEVKYREARTMILKDKVRIDGRDSRSVRPIACEAGILPRAHGSGLFQRGETQVLGVVTLGTGDDELMIDGLTGNEKKKFFLHYNFPPYCVGETGRMGGQSRREIGHGFLAERGLKAVLPDYESFPYTLRMVNEVFESNGSSSMGSVCSGTLAFLDAGVPIKGNVAGIAMGLIKEGDDVAILSDILGDEDHLGDMDFKVAGTRDGITALQMDIKIDSITFDIMEKALAQANEGRNFILTEMEKVIKEPRGQISEYAPRIETIKVKPDKVREVIGAGGKVIKGIIEETGVKIDIEDDRKVNIASSDPVAAQKAKDMILAIVAEPEVGKVYKGKVVRIMDFGAFVEVLPNSQGLLHISEIAKERVREVGDHLKEGEEIDVKILDVDRAGRIKLSRKALLD